jgi:hexaprenyl-diphosphate synthase
LHILGPDKSHCSGLLETIHANSKQARELVLQSDGIEQTRALAQEYVDKAIASIADFPDSEAKDGLIEMAHKSLKRQK